MIGATILRQKLSTRSQRDAVESLDPNRLPCVTKIGHETGSQQELNKLSMPLIGEHQKQENPTLSVFQVLNKSVVESLESSC